MMNFKDFIGGLHKAPIENPSVQVTSKVTAQTLYLKFDNQDVNNLANFDTLFGPC